MGINIYNLAGIIAFLFGSSLALFVGHHSWHNPQRRSFALVTQLAALWCLFPVAASLGYDGEINLLFVRLVYIFGILVPPSILQFIFDVTEDRRPKLKRLILGSTYFLSICFISLIFHPQFIVGIKKHASLFIFIPGNIFHIFAAQYIVICLISFFLLIQNLRRVSSEGRSKLQYVVLASTIGIFSPLLHFSGLYFQWEPFPHDIFFIIYSAIIAYAIVQHQLLDIQLIIRKTLVYSAFVFIASFFYLAIVFILHKIFFPENVYRSSLHLSVISVLVIAFLFKPLEFFFHRLLEKFFFKGTIGEISQQKEKLETELERSERLKSVGVLAAGMAHEIKNPLTAISTFAEYLPTKYDDPEFRKKFSRIVVQEVARIKEIVTNLLLFSKPSEPQKRRCDIHAILKDVMDFLSNEILKSKITVNFKLADDGQAFVDPDQIKQAFLNIVMNAIDALKNHGGQITIETDRSNHMLKISIDDTGCGISKDKLPRIFDPFYSDKEHGTGLGLAVTHTIIEKNNGQISVISKIGEGTKFTINLPL